MKTKKQENRTNDKPNPQAEGLVDLTVADAEAEQAKGGVTLNYSKFEIKYLEQDHRV